MATAVLSQAPRADGRWGHAFSRWPPPPLPLVGVSRRPTPCSGIGVCCGPTHCSRGDPAARQALPDGLGVGTAFRVGPGPSSPRVALSLHQRPFGSQSVLAPRPASDRGSRGRRGPAVQRPWWLAALRVRCPRSDPWVSRCTLAPGRTAPGSPRQRSWPEAACGMQATLGSRTTWSRVLPGAGGHRAGSDGLGRQVSAIPSGNSVADGAGPCGPRVGGIRAWRGSKGGHRRW